MEKTGPENLRTNLELVPIKEFVIVYHYALVASAKMLAPNCNSNSPAMWRRQTSYIDNSLFSKFHISLPRHTPAHRVSHPVSAG